MKTGNIINFIGTYCRQKNIKCEADLRGIYEYGILEIFCGDNLKEGFSLEIQTKQPITQIGVYSALFPYEEASEQLAIKIAEETRKELKFNVGPQPGSYTPPGAKVLEEKVEELHNKGLSTFSVETRYEGQIEAICYLSVARSIKSLQKAIEVVQACRNKHPKKIMMYDIMKKMPEWQEYLKKEYGSDQNE